MTARPDASTEPRTGDPMTATDDFTSLTGEYRAELLVHCYRMLGSADEAEDVVQETYLRAWRGFSAFEGRSSVRTWLYRISTNACLTAIERRGRRPLPSGVGAPGEDPRAPVRPAPDVPWLQPMPGAWLRETPDDPAEVAAARAGTRLALVAAWQYLPARQRAFLILRDVLDWPAAEVADLLDTSTTAVNSGLRRARALVARTLPAQDDVAEPAGHRERALLDRFAAAFEAADVAALATLLRDDVVLEMPPLPAWFTGRGAVLTFVAEKILTTRGRFLLRPAQANGQPAFAIYQRGGDGTYRAHAVQVLTVTPGGIARLDIFLDPGLFRLFGLPQHLDELVAGGAATAGSAAGLSG